MVGQSKGNISNTWNVWFERLWNGFEATPKIICSVYGSDDRGKYPVEIDEFDTETGETERLIIVENYLMKEQVKEKKQI